MDKDYNIESDKLETEEVGENTENTEDSNDFGYCFECGNLGIDGGCPSCGRTLNSVEEKIKEEEPDFIAGMNRLMVPEEYKGIVWKKEIVKKDNPSECKNKHFLNILDGLEKLHKMIEVATIPSTSALFILGGAMGKETFAYSCMQSALARGLSVAPLLDTLEVKRLLIQAAENPRYRLYNQYDYDTYITSDILFLTITKTSYHEEAYSIIMELLARRSRLGLPTFIISRFSIDAMTRRDYMKQFQTMIDDAGRRNSLKYPAIYQFVK